MKILAIETATEVCSGALLIDDQVSSRSQVAPQQHTRLILPMVDELLQEAGLSIVDLDAIAFGQGPGAFTGVRIAIGVVQGLAFAYDLPVIPVSTMATLAQQVGSKHPAVAVAIDARMQEIYWGLFQADTDGLMQAVMPESVCKPEAVSLPDNTSWYGAGSGWKTYPAELSAVCAGSLNGYNGDIFPQAEDLLVLARAKYLAGDTQSVDTAAPVYLRNKVVN